MLTKRARAESSTARRKLPSGETATRSMLDEASKGRVMVLNLARSVVATRLPTGGVEQGVLRHHGGNTVVRGAEEFLEAKIHGVEWKSLPGFRSFLGERKSRNQNIQIAGRLNPGTLRAGDGPAHHRFQAQCFVLPSGHRSEFC